MGLPHAVDAAFRHAGALAWPSVFLWMLLVVSPATAQEALSVLGGRPAAEIGSFDVAQVLEVDGPALVGRREFYRPVPPLDIHSRWILVQDSTFGVVFTDPSGIESDLSRYDSDIYLRAMEDVQAVELRALVFNVWGDPAGYLGVTVIGERTMGERWDLHPRWPADDVPLSEHRTSILWIHRVMFEDESVRESRLEPIAVAYAHVTGSPLERLPEESLIRTTGP